MIKVLSPPAKIGVIGGGQLGRMIVMEAKKMGYTVIVLDPSPDSPAGQIADEQIAADFLDAMAIGRLAACCDVVTYEFEHIDAKILSELELEGYAIYPSGRSLEIIKDKYAQKKMLRKAGLPVADFELVNNEADISRCCVTLGLPFMLKTCFGGYDGKGNRIIRSKDDIASSMQYFEGSILMAEKYVDFERELSIVIARGLDGNSVFYPIAENTHHDAILHLTKVPADISVEMEKEIQHIAGSILEELGDYGVFCIEFFLAKNGSLYINEIAPRPHNSGHYTIEACDTSQFAQLVRVITGMPLGSCRLRAPAVMVNVLGTEPEQGQYSVEGIQDVLADCGVYLHIYGKSFSQKHKKLGHITAIDNSREIAEKKANTALGKLHIKQHNNIMAEDGRTAPKVGIVMGSASDLHVMQKAAKVLEELSIDYEINIVSAHRTPKKMFDYAEAADGRGLKVIIAGAGGSAHLPGMIASLTCIPVIGVPIESRSLGGMDSLLSIVQMPRGVPVATVSINGGTAAGLMAARILSITDNKLAQKIATFMEHKSNTGELD